METIIEKNKAAPVLDKLRFDQEAVDSHNKGFSDMMLRAVEVLEFLKFSRIHTVQS